MYKQPPLKQQEEEEVDPLPSSSSSSSSSNNINNNKKDKSPTPTTPKYALETLDDLEENKNYVKSLLFSSSSSPPSTNNNNLKSPSTKIDNVITDQIVANQHRQQQQQTATTPNQFSQFSFNLSLSPHNESLDKLTRSYLAKNAVDISNIGEDLLVDKSFVFNEIEEDEDEDEDKENSSPHSHSSNLNKNEDKNIKEKEDEDEDEDDDEFKLFARNENYKEKYITKSFKAAAATNYESRLDDDSLYDVMSIGNQTPFKFDDKLKGGGGEQQFDEDLNDDGIFVF
jgi:hypothetical protein